MAVQWREMALLVLVASAVYANSLTGSFHYDDFHSLVQNPHIRNWQQIPDFFVDPGFFSADPEKAMFRPLLLVSYTVNYAFGGYQVLGYHLFNLMVHLVCVLLVWRLAIRLGGHSALCAGLVFALHPVLSEPVNYISSRSESLAVALLLSAMLSYLRRDRAGNVLGPLFYAAALLVKSMAIVLPGLLVLHQCTRDERDLRRLLPYGVVALGYLAIIVSNRFLSDSLAQAPRGLYAQLLTQCKAVVFYLKLVFWPVGMNVEPQFAAADTFSMVVLASAALIASGFYLILKTRRGWFYLGWVGVALSPTLIIPLNVLVNEHRLYLPLAGLALGVGAWWEGSARKKVLLWPGVVCLVACAGLVVQRNAEWRDELSLWSAAAAQSSQMPRVHVHLGNALRDRGDLSAARRAYERALVLAPDHRPARTNLANIYFEAAQSDSINHADYLRQAVRQYEEVLLRDPLYVEALNNLGSAQMMLGEYAQAEEIWTRAIRRQPNQAEAHYNMGLLQVRLGQLSAAVPYFERALVLGEDAETHSQLGNALAGLGRLGQAGQAYRRAIALVPDDIASRYNLAEVLLVLGEADMGQGRRGKALEQWAEARDLLQGVLAQDPGHVRARRRMSQLAERLQ